LLTINLFLADHLPKLGHRILHGPIEY